MQDKQEKKKNHLARRLTLTLMIAISIGVFAFALYNIIEIGSEDLMNKDAYQIVHSDVVGEDTTVVKKGNAAVQLSIDFEKLQEMNPDTVGWVRVPGTDIDYPIVQRDNAYYLSHNFLLEQNRGGAIFLEETCPPDFSGDNTIVYGHNMNDGSMFAQLHQFEDKDFAQKHHVVYIATQSGTTAYEIYAAYATPQDSGAYQTGFATPQDFLANVQSGAALSEQMDTVPVDPQRIITLSTCVKGEEESRYVVQAYLSGE